MWCIRCLTKPFFPQSCRVYFPFVKFCVSARTGDQTPPARLELGSFNEIDGIATVEAVLAAGLCIVLGRGYTAYVREQGTSLEAKIWLPGDALYLF